jgi:hypothetical protein
MKRHLDHHDSSAQRRGTCVVAWPVAGGSVDLSTGMVVVDANRPAIGAGSVHALLSQYVGGAPH